MKNLVGIRRETKDHTQRRCPLSPQDVEELIRLHNLKVLVEPWEQRVFADDEFRAAGAIVTNDLAESNIILGVKEIAPEFTLPRKAYSFFSHTAKGQAYNMPMLQHMMEHGNTLFDYELVKGSDGKRLVFFGDYAGYAGMIDTLWALGKRLAWEGIKTPFSMMEYATAYRRLEDAEDVLRAIGEGIHKDGIPQSLSPLVAGFTGYGHVSASAQRLYDLLPVEEIRACDLAGFMKSGKFSRRMIYKVVFRKPDLYQRKDGSGFDVEEFSTNPELYTGKFEDALPHLTLVVNGIYWEPRFPRLITRDFVEKMFAEGSQRLRVIGDITCDIDGSNQLTVKETNVEDPVYIFDPLTGRTTNGYEGRGVVILAVDKLPAELPLEASEEFGKLLCPFIPALASTDFTVPMEKLQLPEEFRNAIIIHRGVLTPDYSYLNKYLEEYR